jgi:hypothetical protein
MQVHKENGLNMRDICIYIYEHVGMYAPYVCMYIGSIVTSNRDVVIAHLPSNVSISVLPAAVLSGD